MDFYQEAILEDFEVKVHEREQRRYKADTSGDRIYNEKKLVEYLFEIRNK